MENDNKLENLQLELNQQMYNELLIYLNSMLEFVEKDQAFNLVLSALATNLGAILAQVPDKYRNDFISVTNQIITASMTETMKTVDNVNWGQIGHA